MKLIFGLNFLFFASPISDTDLYSHDKLQAVCFSDYVTLNASKRTQFLTRGRTQALWRRDAGRRKMRASWGPDAGALEAGRRQSGQVISWQYCGTDQSKIH
jgi:hypothetical protein